MGKIAGIKNKSPETYPQSQAKPTVIETLSKTLPFAALSNGGPVNLVDPIAFAGQPGGSKATIMFSNYFDTSSGALTVEVEVVLDGDSPSYTTTFAVPIPSGTPTPFSFVFELTGLAAGPHSIQVTGETTAGGETVDARNNSAVVIITSA